MSCNRRKHAAGAIYGILGFFVPAVLAGAQPGQAIHPGEANHPVFGSQIEELTFDNGMRAVLARTPEVAGRAPRVFIGLYVGYGVTSESRPELAHLIEHVAANSRPILENYDIGEDIEYYGSNAMTRADYTSLWRTVSLDGLEPFVPHRANRVAGVHEDAAVFEREIGRVSAELQRSVDARRERGPSIAAALQSAFFGRRPDAAERLELIAGYTPRETHDELARFYRPDNAILVVAGDIDMAATADLVTRHLSAYRDVRTQTVASASPAAGPARFVAYGDPIVVHGDAPVTRVGIGFPAPDRTSDDFVAFLVLDQLLLGGRSGFEESDQIARSTESPLAELLRLHLPAESLTDGRSYAFGSPRLATRSPSYMAVYLESPGTSAARAHATTRTALNDLVDPVTPERVESAKQDLIAFMGGWMMSTDMLSLGDHLAAFAAIDGDPERLNRLPEEIDAVTFEDARALAEELQRSARLAIVARR